MLVPHHRYTCPHALLKAELLSRLANKKSEKWAIPRYLVSDAWESCEPGDRARRDDSE